MTETLFQLSQGVNIGQHAEEFSLELADGSLLESLEIVRRVPGKRLVCRGLWDGRIVFAKLFIGDGAQRYADRDAKGVMAIADAGLLTPPLLYSGYASDLKAQAEMVNVLLFQAIEGSVNAEEAWQAMPPHSPAQYSLAMALVSAVAGHHQAGLVQTDLYLKNFLVIKNVADQISIHTLDGDGIRSSGNGLSRKVALGNLAQLFSKFDVLDDGRIPDLSAYYAQQRMLDLSAADIAQLSRSAMGIRRHAASRYAKKVFRICTDVDVQQNNSRFFAVARPYLDSATFLLQYPDQLLTEQTVRLKSGNTCTVSLVTTRHSKINPGKLSQAESDDLKVVVKRYNIKNFWHGLKRMVRSSRAAVSWSNAHLLIIYGIATATPIALYEKRIGPLRRESYFLAEYVDAPDVASYFADAQRSDAYKELVARNIAQLFFKLRLLMIAHGDFKASNMKIVTDNPVLIDLDSLKQYQCKALFERRHIHDIRRFFRNWQDDPNVRNILKKAFQEQYLGSGSSERLGNTSANLLQSAGLID